MRSFGTFSDRQGRLADIFLVPALVDFKNPVRLDVLIEASVRFRADQHVPAFSAFFLGKNNASPAAGEGVVFKSPTLPTPRTSTMSIALYSPCGSVTGISKMSTRHHDAFASTYPLTKL